MPPANAVVAAAANTVAKTSFSCSSPNQCLTSSNSASLTEDQLASKDQIMGFASNIAVIVCETQSEVKLATLVYLPWLAQTILQFAHCKDQCTRWKIFAQSCECRASHECDNTSKKDTGRASQVDYQVLDRSMQAIQDCV